MVAAGMTPLAMARGGTRRATVAGEVTEGQDIQSRTAQKEGGSVG